MPGGIAMQMPPDSVDCSTNLKALKNFGRRGIGRKRRNDVGGGLHEMCVGRCHRNLERLAEVNFLEPITHGV